VNKCLPWLITLTLLGLWVGNIGGCAAPGLDEESASTKAAESNVGLGVEYMRKGRKEIALEKFQRALDQDPMLPSAHHYIAILYEQLGEEELADKHFRKAVRLDPGNPSMRNNFGQFLCLEKRYPEAQENFLAAINNPLYEGKPVVYTNAGICAQMSGSGEKSEQYFRAALQIQPRFGPALFQMMKMSYERGEYLNARGYFERYRSVVPTSANSLWWGARIETAIGDEDAAASYALRLRAEYPDSVEAKQLKEGR